MDQVQEYCAKMHHSCREGYYHSMKIEALEALRKYPNDPIFKFYHAVSLMLEKQTSDALKELIPLLNKNPVSLASHLASVDAHRAFVKVDKDELDVLEEEIREAESSAPAQVLYFAGLYAFFVGKWEKAKAFCDSAIKYSSQYDDVLCLRGWVGIKLHSPSETGKHPIEFFHIVLKSNPKNLDAMLGQASCYEMSQQFETAIEKLNELLTLFPTWIPALTAKMRLATRVHDTDQATDICNRVICIEPGNGEVALFESIQSLPSVLFVQPIKDGREKLQSGRTETQATTAMNNHLIVRQVLLSLPGAQLVRFRLVSRDWNNQILMIFRDMKECNINVPVESPCTSLAELNTFILSTPFLPYNALTVTLDYRSKHSYCKLRQSGPHEYGEILRRLRLKYLTVNWLHYIGPRDCSAIQFVITLLRTGMENVKYLKIDGIPGYSWKQVDEDWTPWVPKLRLLDVDFPESFEAIYRKLVKAAPNAVVINRYN